MSGKFTCSLIAKVCILLFWSSCFIGILFWSARISFFDDNYITVATWTDLIDPRLLDVFYQQTGIKVHLSYLEDNYELVQKLKASDGEGYDLVIPSDFAVQRLVEYNLLKPLDKKRFAHWERIIPRLLNTYCDPNNNYSIPYHWGIYGVGIDAAYFAHQPEPSWSLIFKKPNPLYRVAVIGAPRETVLMAAQYLFGGIENFSAQDLAKIEQLLIEQKNWVEAYTEFRADYLLLSHTSPAVVITTPHIFRLLKIRPEMRFILPREGSFQVVDSWVIPKKSRKAELCYEFLNFLYEKECIDYHFGKYTFFPATIDLFTLLSDTPAGRLLQSVHQHPSATLDFFRNVVSERELNHLWIRVKAS